MGYYVKVTEQVASQVLAQGVKLTKTKDGNCLLWQTELNGVAGVNLSERCRTVGGALLTPVAASEELKGTDAPAYCFTPEEYGGEGDTRAEVITNQKEDVSDE